MFSFGCISLVLINFAFKNNSHKTVEDKTSRIIIESPKKSNVPDNKEAVNDEGTSVTVPSTYGNPASPIQPLPLPDPNASIVITPLS
jgi:hypothetical protein